MRNYKNPRTILRGAKVQRTNRKPRSIYLTPEAEAYLAERDATRLAVLAAISNKDGALRRGFQFGRLDKHGRPITQGAEDV